MKETRIDWNRDVTQIVCCTGLGFMLAVIAFAAFDVAFGYWNEIMDALTRWWIA